MDTIEIDAVSDGVRILRLNRPERLNALNFAITAALHDALDDLSADETAKVIVLTGAVNGPAYGGGLALAAACDLRIASMSASFCSAFIRTGLTGTDIGITYFLPRLIGAAHAFDMILTGRTVDAAEAERMGLVSRVMPDADLVDSAVTMAEGMAAYTTYGLQRTKEVLWHNLDASSAAAAIALENRNQELGILTPEVRDYMATYSSRLGRG